MPADRAFEPAAAVGFIVYTCLVLVLAALSHRLLRKRSFLEEYFLGSRNLGAWALAMTYAATASSGGSFTGFPALIHEHGWILALWIASYMIVPVCCMGLLGKRLNQVARKSGAITIPDVFRDRFDSPRLGVLASLLMAFAMTLNLVAQFKAGAIIIERLFHGLPAFDRAAAFFEWVPATFSILSSEPPGAGYCLALFIFAGAVIAYTAYGGFRAVVWTDVLQGVVMLLGTLLLLGFTLRAAGGLESVTAGLAREHLATASVESSLQARFEPGDLSLVVRRGEDQWRFENTRSVELAVGGAGKRVIFAVESDSPPPENAGGLELTLLGDGAAPGALRASEFQFDPRRNLVSGPGFQSGKTDGFLPLALAMSFFVMWAISGAGQPTTMVRLMAFDNTRVFRRAMFSAGVYYTLIYIPLIIVFVASRRILPHLDRPDTAMAETVLTVAPAVIAGIIMAAPFAAVMSTVDSYLLAISSSVVRDVYQRTLDPGASARRIRRLTYATTLVVGVLIMLGAVNPPRFLQKIIVLTGASLACTFLAPMFCALYWKRTTAQGAMAGILAGFGVCFGLYLLGWIGVLGAPGELEPHPLGFLPVVWGLTASIAATACGSLLSRRPPAELVARYFHRAPKG